MVTYINHCEFKTLEVLINTLYVYYYLLDAIGHLLATVKELSGQLGATTGVLAITAAVFIVLYNWQIWDRHLWPPGPMPLPFLGNILWIARSKELWKDVLGNYLKLLYLQLHYCFLSKNFFPCGRYLSLAFLAKDRSVDTYKYAKKSAKNLFTKKMYHYNWVPSFLMKCLSIQPNHILYGMIWYFCWTLCLNYTIVIYIWGFFNLIFYWPYVYLIALQKIYGEVMTLHFPFGKRWVVLNSPEAIRQGFIKNADYLSERPPSHKGLIFNCKLLCLGFAMVVVWESTVVWTLTVLGALRW